MASGVSAQPNDFRRLLQASAALGALVFAAGQADATTTLLLAAGGGGGAGFCCTNPGQPGVTAPNGTSGLGAYGGAGGAGGGAGWFGAGGNGVGTGPYSGTGGSGNGGQSKPTGAGGAGGPSFPNSPNAGGGFGGGGGAGWQGGGGGGGYSGGGGGDGRLTSGYGGAGGGGGSFFSPSAFFTGGKDGANGVDNGAGLAGNNGGVYIEAIGHAGHPFFFTGAFGSYVTRYAGVFLLAAVGAQGGSGDTAGDIGGYGALGYELVYLPKGLDLGFLAGGAGHTGDFGAYWGGGGGSFIWAQVPEPSNWLMMDIGVLGVGYALRRRMRKTATAA